MDKNDLLFEQWKMASELHRHNDHINWQKFNFFLIFNGLLLTALSVLWRDSSIANAQTGLKASSGLMSSFGCVVSAVWTLILKRGQLYQNYRIKQARQAEEALIIDGERVLNLYEKGLNKQKLEDVSTFLKRFPIRNLVLFLSVLVTVAWAALAFYFFANSL